MADPLTVDELTTRLRRLGVSAGAVVMVHASLRRIGPVEGRADGVIAAIDRAVGGSGTSMMTLGARDDWAWVNQRPEEDRAGLLAGAEPFDAANTPADPDVGVLAEVYRRHAGTVVSDHPEGRFAARGRLAAALTADQPWDDYYGAGSPLERLVDAGGKVLRLGAGIDTVTLLHYAEFLADVPGKRRVVRHRRIRAGGGAVIRRIETLDDTDGIVEWPGDDYFGLILQAYLDEGRARRGMIGKAQSELIDAADLVAYAAAWMSHNLCSR
jgi:aminoglycoside N3'-acetyltransferase